VQRLLNAAVMSMLIMSGACAHFRVAPDRLSAATLEERRRVQALAWGAMEPLVAPANCNGNGMASVMMTMTVADTFVAVITLGFVRPVTIEWTCAKTQRIGDL
jgi:hypothetical protein